MRRNQYLEKIGIDVFELRAGRQDGVTEPAEEPGNEPAIEAAVEPGNQQAIEPSNEPADEPADQAAAAAPSEATASLDWAALEARVRGCTLCELHRSRTQTVFGVGRRDAELLVIGEAPGADEDRQGEPFVGRAGQLLNAMLRAIGLAREDVFIANILKCRPPSNRDPKPEETRLCTQYLERQIALLRPRAILAVGRIAAQHLLQSDQPIGRLRGQVSTPSNVGIPVVATYHPAYLLRSPQAKAKAWQDLCLVRRVIT
jgi:DNA polymerase